MNVIGTTARRTPFGECRKRAVASTPTSLAEAPQQCDPPVTRANDASTVLDLLRRTPAGAVSMQPGRDGDDPQAHCEGQGTEDPEGGAAGGGQVAGEDAYGEQLCQPDHHGEASRRAARQHIDAAEHQDA